MTAPIQDEETKLVIAPIKPHRAVTSNTIARWLKRLLEDPRIDTQIYSTHSVQCVSCSTASNMDIMMNYIFKSTNWSSGSIFKGSL